MIKKCRNKNVKKFVYIFFLCSTLILSIFICFIKMNIHSNMKYYYPSPNKKYTAIVSETNCEYFVHIKTSVVENDLCLLYEEKKSRKEDIFFSKYSYGKNGTFIIEWEKENDNLWIYSGDIGLYVIQRFENGWQEFSYHEIQNKIDVKNIPEKIKKNSILD